MSMYRKLHSILLFYINLEIKPPDIKDGVNKVSSSSITQFNEKFTAVRESLSEHTGRQ